LTFVIVIFSSSAESERKSSAHWNEAGQVFRFIHYTAKIVLHDMWNRSAQSVKIPLEAAGKKHC
jgi:hypothetical protein